MIALLVLALAAIADSQFAGVPRTSQFRELFPQQAAVGAAPFHAAPIPLRPRPVLLDQPASAQPVIGVVQRSHQLDDNGQFTSSVTQTDGSTFQETGELHPTNDRTDHVLVKKGSYQFFTPEGVPVSISWVADEYGFHPQGSVIPVPVQPVAPTF